MAVPIALLIGAGVRALFMRLATSGAGYAAATVAGPAAARIVYSPGFINGAPHIGSTFTGAVDGMDRAQQHLFEESNQSPEQNGYCTLDIGK